MTEFRAEFPKFKFIKYMNDGMTEKIDVTQQLTPRTVARLHAIN